MLISTVRRSLTGCANPDIGEMVGRSAPPPRDPIWAPHGVSVIRPGKEKGRYYNSHLINPLLGSLKQNASCHPSWTARSPLLPSPAEPVARKGKYKGQKATKKRPFCIKDNLPPVLEHIADRLLHIYLLLCHENPVRIKTSCRRGPWCQCIAEMQLLGLKIRTCIMHSTCLQRHWLRRWQLPSCGEQGLSGFSWFKSLWRHNLLLPSRELPGGAPQGSTKW